MKLEIGVYGGILERVRAGYVAKVNKARSRGILQHKGIQLLVTNELWTRSMPMPSPVREVAMLSLVDESDGCGGGSAIQIGSATIEEGAEKRVLTLVPRYSNLQKGKAIAPSTKGQY